jgi:hypothetical protein
MGAVIDWLIGQTSWAEIGSWTEINIDAKISLGKNSRDGGSWPVGQRFCFLQR